MPLRFTAPLTLTVSLCVLAAIPGAQENMDSRQHTAAENKGAPGSGTARMAAMIAEIERTANPAMNPIMNAKRVEAIRARAAAATTLVQRIEVQLDLAQELLLAGETTEAIDIFAKARTDMKQFGAAGQETVQGITKLLALSYLRLGEQRNCIASHTSDSCLIPIRGSGVHIDRNPAKNAITEYTTLLEQTPDDIGARWLLNLAYMVAGEYPNGVPAKFRISPEIFKSDHDVKRFPDIAPNVGLDRRGHAGGVVMDDFNGDGNLDFLLSSWFLPEQIQLFINGGDGAFADKAAEAGLTGVTGGLHLIQADYDNDGLLDFLVMRGAWIGMAGQGNHPSSLLRNLGNGKFDDVTEKAGLLKLRPTQAAAWGDYDGDGLLDLMIGVESTGNRDVPSELYHNNGDGTFTEASAASGVRIVGFVKGVAWGDFNNDGRPDLYVSRFGQPNQLYRNDGPAAGAGAGAAADKSVPKQPPRWTFTEVGEAAGVTEPLNCFATWFFDYDNDGWQDIFVAPFLGFTVSSLDAMVSGVLGKPGAGATPKLFRNKGDGTFEDVTKKMRLDRPLVVMGSSFGDLDNDGWPDIYLGTGEPDLGTLFPNLMFRNDGGKVFQDVTTSGGFGHLQKGHGIAFGDVDNDGDQDIYAVMGGAYEGDIYQNALFANPGHGNHYLTLQLEGVKANRSAIGARLKVTVATAAGPRQIMSRVGPGGSFSGSPLRQTIGLGTAERVLEVEIKWPGSGAVQVVKDLPMDAAYRVTEMMAPEPMRLALLRLPTSGTGRHPSMLR